MTTECSAYLVLGAGAVLKLLIFNPQMLRCTSCLVFGLHCALVFLFLSYTAHCIDVYNEKASAQSDYTFHPGATILVCPIKRA